MTTAFLTPPGMVTWGIHCPAVASYELPNTAGDDEGPPAKITILPVGIANISQ